MEKPGPPPPSCQRLYSFISLLYFPDVFPNDHKSRLLHCPNFLLKVHPKLLVPNRSDGSCVWIKKGVPSPFVTWLYERLSFEDCVRYSMKHDGPLCCMNLNTDTWGPGGAHVSKKAHSAGDAECSPLTKGWHLHALVFVYTWPIRASSPHTHSGSQQRAHISHRFNLIPTGTQ